MRLHRLLFTALLGLFALTLGAQDVHYTLHNYAPLWLNPANTGSFSGSVRVGGVYRGQWHSLNGINSPTAYADAPINFGLRKQDWIGVGFNMVIDRAGEFDISSTFFGLSAAYHFALDKSRQNVITLGAQYGSTSYGIEMPDGEIIQSRTIANQLGGEGLDNPEMIGMPDMSGNDNYNDINAGIKLKLLLDKKTGDNFEAGVSLLHINNPRRVSQLDSVAGNEDDRRRKPTLHAHARYDMELSDKWRFQPTAFFQTANATSSVSLQAWGSRKLKKDLALRLGLGYRTADAAKVMVGLETGQLRGALAYDITLSEARNVNNYQGAFELGVAYIFNIYKKPDVAPKILCPRL